MNLDLKFLRAAEEENVGAGCPLQLQAWTYV